MNVSPRQLQICRGEILTPDKCEAYRQHWAAMPDGNQSEPQVLINGLSDTELSELFPSEDSSLIGNRIKALTEAIGIPTCGGCESRRQWLNKAHEWLRGTARRAPESVPEALATSA